MSQRLLRLGILCFGKYSPSATISAFGVRAVKCVTKRQSKSYMWYCNGGERRGEQERQPWKVFQYICKHRRSIRMLSVCWTSQIICCRARAHTVQYFRQRQPDMTRPGRKIAPVSMYGGVLMIFNESAFISFHPGYRSFPSLERGSRSNSISIINKKKKNSVRVS